MLTNYQKMQAGFLHDCSDPALLEQLQHCQELCYEFNVSYPGDKDRCQELVKLIFQQDCTTLRVTAPIHCDYGKHIICGYNCFINYNCVFLDEATITLGNNVLIAPNCCFCTVGHPLDVQQRNNCLEIAQPITVGDNVWFGAGVTVCPGVTIGSNTVIGAGSIVVKDIPSGVVAAGNPCKVIRAITAEDRHKYPICAEDISNPQYCW